MPELYMRDEVYRIIGAAMEVHRCLGPGFSEAVYQEAMEIELSLQNVPFTSQASLCIHYKGRLLSKHFVADLLCFEAIIVELKALNALGPAEQAQILNYLKAANQRVGLLINFGSHGKLEWQRFIS